MKKQFSVSSSQFSVENQGVSDQPELPVMQFSTALPPVIRQCQVNDSSAELVLESRQKKLGLTENWELRTDKSLQTENRLPVFQLGSKENLASFWVEPASTGAYNQNAF